MPADDQGATGLVLAALDQFLHGQMLSAWITDYVDIEESLAVGSLAQEELAHAALLLELAGLDVAERDWLIYDSPLSQWWPSRLFNAPEHDWAVAVLRAFLLAAAAAARSGFLAQHVDERYRDAGVVMLAEQELHIEHWKRWIRLLAAHPQTRQDLARAGAILGPAADLFGRAPGACPQRIRDALHKHWLATVAPELSQAGLPTVERPPEPRACAQDLELVGDVLREVRALRPEGPVGARGRYR